MNEETERTHEEQLDALYAENGRLRHEVLAMRQFIDSLQNLMDAVETPRPDSEIMELLGEILDNALAAIDATDGSLLVLDEDSDELVFVLTRGAVPPERITWRRLPLDKGIAGWVATNRRATIVNDVSSDDRFYAGLDADLSFTTRSILAAPIIGGDRVLGVIEVLNKQGGTLFDNSDQTLLTLLCRFAGELLITVMERQRRRGITLG
jgi:GAF domain-containing protein